MFKLFMGAAKSERAVKAIFDHYKNFAIAAVIVAVGVKVFTGEDAGFLYHAQRLSGSCLVVLGLVLIFLNERHGMNLLNQAKLKFFHYIIILVIYGLSSVVFVGQLVLANFGK